MRAFGLRYKPQTMDGRGGVASDGVGTEILIWVRGFDVPSTATTFPTLPNLLGYAFSPSRAFNAQYFDHDSAWFGAGSRPTVTVRQGL